MATDRLPRYWTTGLSKFVNPERRCAIMGVIDDYAMMCWEPYPGFEPCTPFVLPVGRLSATYGGVLGSWEAHGNQQRK